MDGDDKYVDLAFKVLTLKLCIKILVCFSHCGEQEREWARRSLTILVGMQVNVLVLNGESGVSGLEHPLGFEAEVLVVPVVAEVHVGIAPHRPCQLRLRHNLSDGRLDASQARGLVPGPHRVEHGAGGDRADPVEDGHCVLWVVVR